MDIIDTAIAGVKLLKPRRFEDNRGFFFESYNKAALEKFGFSDVYVQDNHSYSAVRGTLRGLHYQIEPQAQVKLVRVVRGSVLDVAVDVRPGSKTRGKYVSAFLSAENMQQLYIPAGFAHGFCTLEDDTEVLYKVTSFYSPQHERGIFWDDPDLGIEWPVPREEIILAERDAKFPRLSEQTDF